MADAQRNGQLVLVIGVVEESPPDLAEEVLVPGGFLLVPKHGLLVELGHIDVVQLALESLRELMGCFYSGDLGEEAITHVWSHGRLLDLRNLSEYRSLSAWLRVILLSRHPQEGIRWTEALTQTLTLLLVLNRGRDDQVVDRLSDVVRLLICVRERDDL